MFDSKSPQAEGLRRALPIMLGYLPVGFAFGVLAVKNSIVAPLAIAMSVLMFSGSGQLIFVSMWGAGSSALSIIAAIFIVNLRYLMQSAAEAPFMTGLPKFQRFLLGLGLTDETFAVHVTAFMQGWKRNLTTLFVCNHLSQLGWISGTILGVYCGDLISDVRPLGIDFALTAMFLALLVLQCLNSLYTFIAVITVIFSVILKLLGMTQWNIVVASLIGATLGAILVSFKTKASK
ncbi:MAG: AzlC family ABC transporter permease [Desulfovibrionaceae bacterium]|nr:AzlC family ABC transporter permease [Desulfovibrionaceae bacterium]